ncbi:zinc-dependent metalloprotease [Sphingomonas sp. MMS24-JH45]
MDYPAPRITLVDGAPDLSDAWRRGWRMGRGVGRSPVWAARARPVAGGRRPREGGGAGGIGPALRQRRRRARGGERAAVGQPVGRRRRSRRNSCACSTCAGPRSIASDWRRCGRARRSRPRRKFVPIWLLHRYQVEAAAKLVGGRGFTYPVAGGGREGAATPVAAGEQRAALDALFATLESPALTVPAPRALAVGGAQRGRRSPVRYRGDAYRGRAGVRSARRGRGRGRRDARSAARSRPAAAARAPARGGRRDAQGSRR